MKILLLLVLSGSALLITPASAFDLDALAGRASDAAKEHADKYELPPAIVEQARELASSLGLSQANLVRYANDALKALDKDEYLSAFKHLDRIGSAKLTAGQASAFQDLKVLVDGYALQRSFEASTPSAGPIGQAVTSISSKDYAGAASQLQQAISSLRLSGSQLEILSALRDQYAAWAAKDE